MVELHLSYFLYRLKFTIFISSLIDGMVLYSDNEMLTNTFFNVSLIVVYVRLPHVVLANFLFSSDTFTVMFRSYWTVTKVNIWCLTMFISYIQVAHFSTLSFKYEKSWLGYLFFFFFAPFLVPVCWNPCLLPFFTICNNLV